MELRDLDKLLADVLAEAGKAGIPVSGKIRPTVQVNTRAQSRFGCCTRRGEGYVIEVSARMLSAEERAVKQVLAHEVLHTCRGCANHGLRWQKYAARMNEMYGYDIVRADSFEKLGLVDDRKMRYAVVCVRCGRKLLRMRRSAVVDHPERYRCGCGGQLRVEVLDQG